MRSILPSITSVGRCATCASSWRDKIHELVELEIRECALFVTGLNNEERNECFMLLKKLRMTHEFSVPFCHAVSTMHEDDYRFLRDDFGTVRFNLHPVREFPLLYPLGDEVRSMIFIENSGGDVFLDPSDLDGFAGICLDISHLYDLLMTDRPRYEALVGLLKKTQIGANHISGASAAPLQNHLGGIQHSKHVASSLSDFDYIDNFPSALFSTLCAIEVENSIKEQLGFKTHIESILSSMEQPIKRAA